MSLRHLWGQRGTRGQRRAKGRQGGTEGSRGGHKGQGEQRGAVGTEQGWGVEGVGGQRGDRRQQRGQRGTRGEQRRAKGRQVGPEGGQRAEVGRGEAGGAEGRRGAMGLSLQFYPCPQTHDIRAAGTSGQGLALWGDIAHQPQAASFFPTPPATPSPPAPLPCLPGCHCPPSTSALHSPRAWR